MFGRIIAAAVLTAAIASPAVAAQQDFTLENSTGYTIEQVFVSAATTKSWEEDILGKDTLPDGEEVEITFPKAESACRFDLKVIYDDKDEAEWGNINLCEVSHVELHYNRTSGATSATVR